MSDINMAEIFEALENNNVEEVEDTSSNELNMAEIFEALENDASEND